MISSLVKYSIGEIKETLYELREFWLEFSQPNFKYKQNLIEIQSNLMNRFALITSRITGDDLYSIERDITDLNELKSSINKKDNEKATWLLNAIEKRQKEYLNKLNGDEIKISKFLIDIKSIETKLCYGYAGLAASFSFGITCILCTIRKVILSARLIDIFPQQSVVLFAGIVMITFIVSVLASKFIENSLSTDGECQEIKRYIEKSVNNGLIGLDRVKQNMKRFSRISFMIDEEKQTNVSKCDEIAKQYKKFYDDLKSLVLHEFASPVKEYNKDVSSKSSWISKDWLVQAAWSYLIFKAIDYTPVVVGKIIELLI